MGSKLLSAGNTLAILVTILAFLQAISWPIAGAIIIAVLGSTLFLNAKQNMPPSGSEKGAEVKPAHKLSSKSPFAIGQGPQESESRSLHTKPITAKSRPEPPRPVQPKEEPGTQTIKEGEYITFDVDLEEGREVVAEVSATGSVNAYIMTEENVTALELDQEFWYEDGSEGVQKATLRFTTEEKGKWFLLVENDSHEEVTVNVKMNITKTAQPVPFLKTGSLEFPDQKLWGKLP